ncbi:radical SAM protein [Anaerosolibacter sp.]|uniref:radical SAM protein n=1 Tax=Anaerosolibacter sp. TaxID=1872527 RepID=UPI0039EF808E
MRIGLIDVDGHNFPNLALMKISAYHKSVGNRVEMAIPMMPYDQVYISKIFDFTPDFITHLDAKEIFYGGRAYDKKIKLIKDIETMSPDYSLYGINDTAYGYLTRGCPRGCDFCDVKNIEGLKSYKVANLDQFWKGQKHIKLLDPNLLAAKDREELLMQLIASKAWIDFTQGLDIRFMNDEIIELFKKLKIKMIHFAWDKEKDSDLIIKNLEHFKKNTGIDKRKAAVYVLTNYDTDFEFDLYRVYKLRELGFHPYVMIYNKASASKKIRHLQRWVNNRIIFETCERFEDFNSKLG